MCCRLHSPDTVPPCFYQAGSVFGAANQDKQTARGGFPGSHLPAQSGVSCSEIVERESRESQPEGESVVFTPNLVKNTTKSWLFPDLSLLGHM